MSILAGGIPTPGAAIVFLAGVVSFLSPCVLPLLPAYLSYVSGVSIETVRGGRAEARRIVIPILFFILGFTTVFVALGVTASLISAVLISNQRILRLFAGALIVVMGVIFLGIVPLPWLYSERRLESRPGTGFVRNYIMGFAFGFGWTPCIGPTLGLALGVASTQQTAGKGALLLLIYSLGLGIPFILSALGVSKLTGALAWFRKRQKVVMRASGSLLIAFGVLLMFNQVFRISIIIQRTFERLGLEELVGI